MRRGEVKTIIRYYNGIPDMVRLLEQEKLELENEYNGLRAAPLDGSPHSAMIGRSTEEQVVRLDEKKVLDRLQEIDIKKQVLQMDVVLIRGCLDELNDKYKSLVFMRYQRGYSWAKISLSLGVPDGTVRHWNDRMLERLRQILDDVPMIEEISDRALRSFP